MLRKHKLILITVISCIFIFSSTAAVFADSAADTLFQEELMEDYLLPDDMIIEDVPEIHSDIAPYAATGITIIGSFKQGTASIRATAPSSTTSLSCTIRLQEKSGSSYVNSNCSPISKTVSKKSLISCGGKFKVSSKKTYRIKITVTAKYNGHTVSQTGYRSHIR